MSKDKKRPPEQELAAINIGNINGGHAIDAFDLELRKVLENIADLSTKSTATRSITLRVDFKPHSDRCKIETEFHCSSKLAAIETNTSQIYVGRTKEGYLVAFDADPRQMPLWEAPKPQQVPVVEFSTGK